MRELKSIKLTMMLSAKEMRLLKLLAEKEHSGLSHTVRALIHRAAKTAKIDR